VGMVWVNAVLLLTLVFKRNIRYFLVVNKKGLKFNDLKPFFVTGVPAETRTLDPLIKSQLLYQLSYGDIYFKPLFRTLDPPD
jgi:hypothetical protein